MKQVTMSVRLDEDTKRDFDVFCRNIGLPASSVMNLFAKTVVRERRIPFEITDRVSDRTEETLMKSIGDLDAGLGVHKTFDELEKMRNG